MKHTVLDRIIEYFSPRTALKRYAQKRAYEAAKTYVTSDWIGSSDASANSEVASGQKKLQQKSRDLARNNPYVVRAHNVIVNNTVGAGIVANIKGKNKTQVKKLTKEWDRITNSSLCDAEGRFNFYQLQALVMRSTVESGETIGIKEIHPESPKVRVLESDFIVSDQNTSPFYQGIKVDKFGKIVSFLVYKQHPGEKQYILGHSGDYVEVSADKVSHVLRIDRPGQLRSVPWAHAVIETLKDLADYQYSTLIARKISACLVGFIETQGNDNVLDAEQLKAKRQAEQQIVPGTWRYGNPGEKVSFSSPPSMGGYSEFIRECLRSIAAGFGISYEAFTGDYSQVNFSSGRMGHLEFRRNIDSWRWNMLIPQFCEPFAQSFLEWAKARGMDVEGVTFEWVPPAHTMIDPTKEIAAEKEAVLAGFKSRSQVIREQGNDPDMVRAEIKSEREEDKAAGVKFDTDIQNVKPTSNTEGMSEQDNEAQSPTGTTSDQGTD